MKQLTIVQIPFNVCKEKKYVYLRYVTDNISKPFKCNYHKGDIVKCDLTDIRIDPTMGFLYEANCVEEVSNVDRLLLDAGKIKYTRLKR